MDEAAAIIATLLTFAMCSGIKEMGENNIYPGLPSMWDRSKQKCLDFILDRVEKQARSWKHKLLSNARREVMVSELLDENSGTWNLDLLEELFSQQEVDAISCLPLPCPGLIDKFVWCLAKNGSFSVKLGYLFLTRFGRPEPRRSLIGSNQFLQILFLLVFMDEMNGMNGY